MTEFREFMEQADLAMKAAEQLRQLVLDVSVENCPLLPCEACPLVDCTLRKPQGRA